MAALAAERGIRMSSKDIRLLAKRYLAGEFGPDAMADVITYADPTGETAVRNVLLTMP